MTGTRNAVRTAAAAVVAMALAGSGVLAQGAKAGVTDPPQAVNSPVGTLDIEGMAQGAAIYGFGLDVTHAGGAPGGGGGAGTATVSDVHVLRIADAASPQLFRAATLGVHIASVKVTLFASGKTVPEATYVLRDVMVSRISSAPGAESLSFRFGSIDMQAGGASFCYDVAANSAC